MRQSLLTDLYSIFSNVWANQHVFILSINYPKNGYRKNGYNFKYFEYNLKEYT